MLKSILSTISVMLAVAGLASAGVVNTTNATASLLEVQDNSGAIAGGFLVVGTTAASDAALSDPTLAQDALADFTQFGGSTTFGTPGVGGNAGFFSLAANGDGGSAAFSGNQIYLIGGNGSDIASSSYLFIVRSDATFGPDLPLFSGSVNIGVDNTLLGAVGGTNALNGGDAFQMEAVGGIIPEPAVSILALFSVGLLVLRRRR